MTFSGKVKHELELYVDSARHCQIAELSAIFSFCGEIQKAENGEIRLCFSSENESVVRKCFTLLQKTFKIDKEISIDKCLVKKNNRFVIEVREQEDSIRILQAAKYLNGDRLPIPCAALVNPLIVQRNCCRRAFLRGAFLCAGSISDPEKFYHFEIVCSTLAKARQLQELIRSFEVDAKVVSRKRHEVVYVKEGAQIVEILGLMGANISLLNLENVRILKEMRNSVNRQVNCETANINKTVNAAVKQVEDITYIRDTIGLQKLPDNLEEIAELRLAYPQASLKELGMLLSPQVGKSGVNHRLRRIGGIAEELRGNKEEQV